uniref:Uncharacterized protein n=1 Tax=viral metagenome TaxID=1070528 RepID=A0A6C0K1K4_9ZZZZ
MRNPIHVIILSTRPDPGTVINMNSIDPKTIFFEICLKVTA